MDLFNNREKALIVLILAGLIIALFSKQIRHSVFDVIRMLFHPQIIAIFGLTSLYVAVVVLLLIHFNLWTTALIKDTVVWLVATGFVFLLEVNKGSKEEGYFKKKLLDALKLVLILEFLVNFYTFSFTVEITLQIAVIVLAIFKLVFEKNSNLLAAKIVNWTLAILGSIYFINALSNILLGFQTLITMDNLRSFLLSPALTIAFIPFLYAISLFFVYNEFFAYLTTFLKNDRDLASFTKRKIFLFCNLNLSKFNRFIKDNRVKLYHLQSRQELLDLFHEFKTNH